MSGPLLRTLLVVLTLWSSIALAGDEPLAVLILGAPPPPPAATPLMPGQMLRRANGVQLPASSPPGLAVLVDGKARILVDPASGSVGLARSLGQNLSEVSAVLLTSMRPAASVDVPVLLTDSAGPTATVRLLGPGGAGRWPSAARWAEVLFGGSGLYRTAGARVPRLSVDEVKSGAERRVSLSSGVELAGPRGSRSGWAGEHLSPVAGGRDCRSGRRGRPGRSAGTGHVRLLGAIDGCLGPDAGRRSLPGRGGLHRKGRGGPDHRRGRRGPG